MSRLRATFASLSIYNYRLYFGGHVVSVTGSWVQRVGQAWLVLELTESGTLLGATVALQHLPILLLGSWGGLLADRVDKRRLLILTQVAAALLALLLGLLTLAGVVTAPLVMVLAFAHGMTKAVEQPTKRSFVPEMVPPEMVTNAVTLNSVAFNGAKLVGPAVAGFLIMAFGLPVSFFVNAASYIAMLAVLGAMDTGRLRSASPAGRKRGQVREGLRYVGRTPELLAPLLLMAISGTLAYSWDVTLPLLARETFDGDAQTVGTAFSAMGLGAVAGGLLVVGTLRAHARGVVVGGLLFGSCVVLVAIAPTLSLAVGALVALGAVSIAFRAVTTAFLQLRCAPEMRGRVMALLVIATTGTTPLGAPLAGWIAETAGPRFALAVGGVGTVVAASAAFSYLRRAAALDERDAARAPVRGEA